MLVEVNDSDRLRLRLKCLLMKVGLVVIELPDLETHPNRIQDFFFTVSRFKCVSKSGTHSRFRFRDISVLLCLEKIKD